MRTTINLPDDLHELARHLAHDSNRSMSEVIAELLRAGLRREAPVGLTSSRGLPMTTIGRTVTAEDVRSLEDEDSTCCVVATW